MNLATAESLVRSQLQRIDTVYLRPLFDEWAILSVAASGVTLITYQGKRADTYRERLPQDSAPLRAAMARRSYAVGDFEFALEAAGTGYDAGMKVGESAYLVCNNLAATMDELRKDPQWLKAQVLWFELGEKFRADPLV
ncbi:MAG: hypothetical protein U1F61_02985 [Opitutaceae bacterium]